MSAPLHVRADLQVPHLKRSLWIVSKFLFTFTKLSETAQTFNREPSPKVIERGPVKP
jgi:hypothetical protein